MYICIYKFGWIQVICWPVKITYTHLHTDIPTYQVCTVKAGPYLDTQSYNIHIYGMVCMYVDIWIFVGSGDILQLATESATKILLWERGFNAGYISYTNLHTVHTYLYVYTRIHKSVYYIPSM